MRLNEIITEQAKHGLYYNVNRRKAAGTSRPASSPKAPTAQAWKDAAKTVKKKSVAEGSLEEVDRRGFLKGVGAAAVTGIISPGAKAQSTDYVQVANNAVRQAEQIVTGYTSIMVGQRRSYFANYVRENVYNQTIWYLNNTNGYNAAQAVNYALSMAKTECDNISTGIGDFIGGAGLRDNLGMKIVNTFVQTYSSALQQKLQQARQGATQQSQQSAQQKTPATLSQEENAILTKALYVYYFTKNSPEDVNNFKQVSKEIGNFITAQDAKSIVNDSFRKISDFLENTKETDPKQYAGFSQWVKINGQQAIDDLKNLLQPKSIPKKDEFQESVEQGVAEGASKKCPPATQDITLNLKNRQKAIDEYGYGPLNPDLPNTKFWMKKVDEWNLDSVQQAKQSLCGNCAAFDQRADTLACIAQGIDSDQGAEDPTIQAGDLGYCRFLKFKCAAKRTCDAWVTGGPLTDQQDVAEALDPKFVSFMNKSLDRRQDPAAIKYNPETTMSINNTPAYKYAFEFGMNLIRQMDPETQRHFANADDDTLYSHMIKVAKKKGLIPGKFYDDDLQEVVGNFEEIFHDPGMEGWSWADLLRDMIGVPVQAQDKANVQAHKAQMRKPKTNGPAGN